MATLSPFSATWRNDVVRLLGGLVGITIDTDGTMAADSDTRVPSQKAVNTRINNALANRNCFSAYKGSNQGSITSATETKITFTTEEFDNNNRYDATNSIWTPVAGVVRVHAQVHWAAANQVDQSALLIYIYKNGAMVRTNSTRTSGANGGSTAISALIAVNGTDTIEIYARADGAGDKTVSGASGFTFFCGEQIVES